MNVLNVYIITGIISAFVLVLATIVIMIFSPNAFNRSCAIGHNRYRHFHRSPFLTVANEVVKYAEERAKELSITNIFAHPKNSTFGENLYKIRFVSDKPESLDSFECETALERWYNEIDDYDFETGNSKNGKMVGHFTQMVWTDTAEIGCAKSYSSKSMSLYLVCNYSPPGNWMGSFVEKVPRPN